MLPFAIRDALLCIVFLIGMGAGIFAIAHKRVKAGGFALAGFFVFGLEPISDFIILNILSANSSISYNTLNWTYACIGGFASTIGSILIITALYLSIQPEQSERQIPI